MSFKKKPRVYEILRTPEVWEKVILCTNDFSSCRSSASSFFADDIRVIPPLVLNKLCKLREPSLLPLHFLRVYTYSKFSRKYTFWRKKDVISCSTPSLRCATAPALPLDCGYFAYRVLSRIRTNAIYPAYSIHPMDCWKKSRWKKFSITVQRGPFSCKMQKEVSEIRDWREAFNTWARKCRPRFIFRVAVLTKQYHAVQ